MAILLRLPDIERRHLGFVSTSESPGNVKRHGRSGALQIGEVAASEVDKRRIGRANVWWAVA